MNEEKYRQTWPYVARIKNMRIRKIIQAMCGLITGHELSKTEWGYGGGAFADRWCRWCNKKFRVPKESIYFVFKDSRELMKEVTKNTDMKMYS